MRVQAGERGALEGCRRGRVEGGEGGKGRRGVPSESDEREGARADVSAQVPGKTRFLQQAMLRDVVLRC